MITAVIFDKDGTLFDFRKSWAGWADALLQELSGGDPARGSVLGAAIGFDIDLQSFSSESPVIAGTAEDIADLLMPHLPDSDERALVARMNDLAAGLRQVEAVPLRACLLQLRDRGLRLGVVTNDAEAPARAHLAAADVADLFDFVAGYDSGHGAKPLPGPLLAGAAEMAVAPGQVVMVGDSLHDLRAGRAAGMRAVAVLTGVATAESLGPHADVVLDNIGDLVHWIDAVGR